jgi:hypothetical protein
MLHKSASKLRELLIGTLKHQLRGTALAVLALAFLTAGTGFAACNGPVSISPPNAYIPASGGWDYVDVTAPPGCLWTVATTDPRWIILAYGTQGVGNGRIWFFVNYNPTDAPRSAEVHLMGILQGPERSHYQEVFEYGE